MLLVYGDKRMAIEVEVWHDKQADPLADGLAQFERYLNHLTLNEGFLVIFDRRSTAPA